MDDEILKYMENNYTDEDIEKFIVYYCFGKSDSITMTDLFSSIAISVYVTGGEDLIDKYEHKRKYQKRDRTSANAKFVRGGIPGLGKRH